MAIFSLSLMAANVADYVAEAYRTLEPDGQLHVLEATQRFTDRESFVKALEGWASIDSVWRTSGNSRTSEHSRPTRRPREDLDLRF